MVTTITSLPLLPLGAGKTYTMLGSDNEPGIMVHTLNNLFKKMEETKDEVEYLVSMAYLEVTYIHSHTHLPLRASSRSGTP